MESFLGGRDPDDGRLGAVDRDLIGGRGTVAREALLSAGVVASETKWMAADVTMTDGSPRYV